MGIFVSVFPIPLCSHLVSVSFSLQHKLAFSHAIPDCVCLKFARPSLIFVLACSCAQWTVEVWWLAFVTVSESERVRVQMQPIRLVTLTDSTQADRLLPMMLRFASPWAPIVCVYHTIIFNANAIRVEQCVGNLSRYVSLATPGPLRPFCAFRRPTWSRASRLKALDGAGKAPKWNGSLTAVHLLMHCQWLLYMSSLDWDKR